MPRGERKKIVKRDVVAAITFLMTGLLFYLARVEGPTKNELSSESGCGNPEAVMVGDSSIQAPVDLVIGSLRSWES